MASREELVNALCGGASCSRCGVVYGQEELVVWNTEHDRLDQFYGIESAEWYTYSTQELLDRFNIKRGSPRYLLCNPCCPSSYSLTARVYLNVARRSSS